MATLMSNKTMSNKTPNEAETLVNTAYDQILLQIVQGALPSGTKLKTMPLSNQLGLSRTPVVQALQRLIADGIVTQVPQKCYVVAEGAEHWLINTHEIRLLLEPQATFYATKRLKADVLETLEDYAEAAKPDENLDWIPRTYLFDYHLHTSIARASGNLPLCEAICKGMSFKRLLNEVSNDSPDRLRRDHSEHQMILDSLKKREPETASAAMRYHLTNSLAYRKLVGNII